MRAGVDVPLPRLSFDLLIALAKASPNLASLDELMARVWPGLVVSPETVSQRVKLLRDALGDDPKRPRYVLGVRGRGYRLCAPVESATENQIVVPARSPANPSGPNATPNMPPMASRRRELVRLAVAVGGILLAATLAVLFLRKPGDSRPAARIEIAAAPPRSIAVLPFENLNGSTSDHVMALGVPEAVLHQLAALNELIVIARTSSFAYGSNQDARTIGRELNARYLLEGSVQSVEDRLRITAQLVDAQSGAHLWSMRFDRTRDDIFAVQDEIAAQVARALELSIDAGPAAAATRDTQNVDAWLAFMQGRALLATRKLADLGEAKHRFEEAIRLDGSFGSAYSALAEAYVLEAFFPNSEHWFNSVPPLPPRDAEHVKQLLARALEINPQNGDAYIIRAWMRGNGSEAEGDFRKGLAMSPNNAAGYERFARLLAFMTDENGAIDIAKRNEAFVMVERARSLDPLTPTHHVTKALMELYTRSNVQAADALLMQALDRDPNYYPALMRLAELRWCCQGQYADAVRLGERALAIEPAAMWPRPFLIHFYVDMQDIGAARHVVATSPRRDSTLGISIALHEGDRDKAAELAASPPPRVSGLDLGDMVWAFGLHQYTPHRSPRDLKWLEDISGVSWEGGSVQLLDSTNDFAASVALGESLALGGDRTRARAVWEQALARMDREIHANHRGEMWFGIARPRVLALLGRDEEALAVLERSFASGFQLRWEFRLAMDPAMERLRSNPRFQSLLARAKEHMKDERRKLQALRDAGLVPARDPVPRAAVTAAKTSP